MVLQDVLQQCFTLSLLALQERRLGALTSLDRLFVEPCNRVIASVDVGCDALGNAGSTLQQADASVGDGLTYGALDLLFRCCLHELRAAWLLSLSLCVCTA